MCGVRSKLRLVAFVVTALVLAAGVQAQKAAPRRARRETNAARQARIAKTIEQTYSHRYEVFGGGGYMRFRSGQYLKKNNEVRWVASGSYFLNPKVAVVAEAGGQFGYAHALTNNIYGVYQPQINEYTFLGGGSYRFYAHDKTALSAQAMGGVGWGIFSGGSKAIPATLLGLWPDGFKPAFQFSVNADYNLYPNLAVRFSPTYTGTTFGNTVQNNLGFNAGVVYRFGQQK